LRRNFFDEIETDRASRGCDQFAQMFVRAGLRRTSAKLQDVFGGGIRVQMKFPARPLRSDADRCCRGEAVPFGFTAKTYLDGNVPAAMTVDVTMPVDLQNFECQVDVNGRMLVDAIFDFSGLVQGFFTFANKHEDLGFALADHVTAKEYLPKGLPQSGGGYLGFGALAVEKVFNPVAFHIFTSIIRGPIDRVEMNI
jgi:hypothetical protein